MKNIPIIAFIIAAFAPAIPTVLVAQAPAAPTCTSLYCAISVLLDPLRPAVQGPFAEEAAVALMAKDFDALVALLETVKTL